MFTICFMPDFNLFNFLSLNYFKKFFRSSTIVIVFIILKACLKCMFSKWNFWVKA